MGLHPLPSMQAIHTLFTLRERRERVVREHIAAENNHDIPRTLATFHRPKYEVAPFGAPNIGAESVHELLTALFAAFPDFHVEVPYLHHADTAVIAEFIMTGTHRGPFAGLPASGQRVRVPIVGIFDFEEDRLMCERVYFDMATMTRQMQPLAEAA